MEIRLRPETLDDPEFTLGVIRTAPDQTVTYINRALTQLLDGELAVGDNISKLGFDPASRAALTRGIATRFEAERGSAYPLQVVLPRRGTIVRARVAAVPEYDAAGGLIGSVGVVADTSLDTVSMAMHRAVDEATTSAQLLGLVAEHLRELVAFDSLSVTAISADGRYLRRLSETPEPPEPPPPLRWWPMPSFVRAMVCDQQASPLDLDELFARPEYVELARTDQSLQQFKSRGLRHALRLPVRRRGRHVAIVTLMRLRKGIPFGDAELRLCEQLPLREAVNWAMTLDEQDHQRLSLELIDDLLRAADDPAAVRQRLVDGLWERFGWEHVSLFQHVPHRGMLKLACQAARAPMHLREDYEQTVDDRHGLIARAWREEKVVNEASVQTLPGHQPAAAGVRSELVMPLPGCGRRWLLNVEATNSTAFAAEECEAVEALLRVAAMVLERSEAIEMSQAVLEHIADVVIRTSRENTILDINRAGTVQLQEPRENLIGRTLDVLVKDPSDDLYLDDRDEFGVRTTRVTSGPDPSLDLLHTTQRSSGTLELRRGDGSFVKMLVSVAPLPGEHGEGGEKVFVASDLTGQEYRQRVNDLVPRFKQLLSEIRVPLALAASYLDEADEGADAHAMSEAALREIAKADVSVERVMRVAAATDAAPLPGSEFALRNVISALQQQLPREATRWLQVTMRGEEVRVSAAFDELLHCLQHVVARLVVLRDATQIIHVRLGLASRRRAFISVRLCEADGGAPCPVDDVELKRDVEPLVRSLLQRMGGELHAEHERGLYRLIVVAAADTKERA